MREKESRKAEVAAGLLGSLDQSEFPTEFSNYSAGEAQTSY